MGQSRDSMVSMRFMATFWNRGPGWNTRHEPWLSMTAMCRPISVGLAATPTWL